MELGIEKFIRKLLMKKYPTLLDITVNKHNGFNPHKKICYDVILIVHIDDSSDFVKNDLFPIRDYLHEIAKYMDVAICGLYRETVDDDEWEEIKSGKIG